MASYTRHMPRFVLCPPGTKWKITDNEVPVPYCAQCNKAVERICTEENLCDRQYLWAVYCHGRKEIFRVDRHFMEDAGGVVEISAVFAGPALMVVK